MTGKYWLTVPVVLLGLWAGTSPARAENVGLYLDVGGKLVTRTSPNGTGMGPGVALTYIFPEVPIGLSIGARYLTMTNLAAGSTGYLVDVPFEVSYNFLDAAPGLNLHLYIGNDIEFVTTEVTGARVSQTQAANPSFGAGARWFFAPQFGVFLTAGGRVALDNGTTFQFVSNVGTSLRF